MNVTTDINDPLDDFANALLQIEAAAEGIKSTKGALPNTVMIECQPADEYHGSVESVSNSSLKHLLDSPAHYKLAQTSVHESTEAMTMGSLVHILTLQPELFNDEYVIYPGDSAGKSRNKDYTEMVSCNLDRTVIDMPTFNIANRMVAVIRDAKYKGRSIGNFIDESLKEVSIYVTEPTTGLRLRVRPDIYHPEITFDLKTTAAQNMRKFCRDAVLKFHYDMQAYMYAFCRALYEGTSKGRPFVFVAAESAEPHSVFVANAGESFVENGAKKFLHCLKLYKACTDVGIWPNASAESELEVDFGWRFTGA